jgi:type III secretory pathway component EscT
MGSFGSSSFYSSVISSSSSSGSFLSYFLWLLFWHVDHDAILSFLLYPVGPFSLI